jgi:hypothetical protein
VKMIVEKQMECRLAGETEVLWENLPQRHFWPSQNPTWPDPGLNPGLRGGKPATNRLSYGAAPRRAVSNAEIQTVLLPNVVLQWYYYAVLTMMLTMRRCVNRPCLAVSGGQERRESNGTEAFSYHGYHWLRGISTHRMYTQYSHWYNQRHELTRSTRCWLVQGSLTSCGWWGTRRRFDW